MQMHLAITVRPDDNLDELRGIVAKLRKHIGDEHLTVLEAPKNFDYPFQFPLLTISDGEKRARHFGSEALELLREVLQKGLNQVEIRP